MDMLIMVAEQMLMMFALMAAGFLLRKKEILPKDTPMVLSRLETYLFLPALNLASQLKNCTVKSFSENYGLVLYGLLAAVLAVATAFLVSPLLFGRLRQEDKYRYNIYKYSMIFANYGFLGNFLVLGIWGSEGLFKYLLFTFPLAFLVNTLGMYLLTPEGEKLGIIKRVLKALVFPPTLAMLVGALGGLLGVSRIIPDFLDSALESAKGCMGPVAMVFTGIVLGGCDIKKIITNKNAWLATLFRLIIIPAALLTVLSLLGADREALVWATVMLACPLGLNTVVVPASYGRDADTGASMALISSTFAIVTLPLVYYVFLLL